MAGASYRFGPFDADRVRYQLQRDGAAVDLTPKLLDLLFHLLDHAGDLVTKESLLDALWGDANVTDNALAQAVSELRDALGDEPSNPAFIRTIARKGYRFIGEVTRIDADAGTVRTPDEAIAVLDFTNVTGDRDAAWLSVGIAETVTSDLRSLERFRVIDRWRVVEAARRTDGSLAQVGAALHARFAVVGSFQQLDRGVRITARLVDLATGEALADAKVDGPLDRIFALQDDVVRQLASEFGLVNLEREASAERRSRETTSLEAHRAFSQGWLHLEALDVRETPKAVAEFERAVAADGRYALAYTGLATAEFAQFESTRAKEAPAQDVLKRAIEHARHAIQLDPNLAEAHATLALVLTSAWQTAEAAEAARRAVALEPGNWRHLFRLGHATWGDERLRAAAATLDLYPDFAFSHFQIAMVHVARGRLRDAETVLRQGAAVQDRQISRGGRYPALGLHWLLGLVHLADGGAAEAADAIEEFDRERRLAEPHRLYGLEYAAYALLGRGAALLRLDRPTEAIEAFNAALEMYPGNRLMQLGLALARAESDTGLRRLRPVSEAPQTPAPPLVRAQLLAAGDEASRRQAVALLDEYLQDAPPGFAGWTIPVEPFLSELQSDQQFAAVLMRLRARAE